MKPSTALVITWLAGVSAAVPNVHAQTYCPDDANNYQVVWGGETTGDALELCVSDDEYLEVKQRAQFTPIFPVIELHYFEGQRVADIAEFLELSGSTIKWRIHKAREVLQRTAKINGYLE